MSDSDRTPRPALTHSWPLARFPSKLRGGLDCQEAPTSGLP
jgi:hypothetical protein